MTAAEAKQFVADAIVGAAPQVRDALRVILDLADELDAATAAVADLRQENAAYVRGVQDGLAATAPGVDSVATIERLRAEIDHLNDEIAARDRVIATLGSRHRWPQAPRNPYRLEVG